MVYTDPTSLDRLGDLLYERGLISQARNSSIESGSASNWLNTRFQELTDQILLQMSDQSTDLLSNLKEREKARVAAAAGMLAVLPSQGELNYDSAYRQETLRFMGVGATVLNQINLIDAEVLTSSPKIDKSQQLPVEVECPPEFFEVLPTGPTVGIDVNGEISVNGNPFILLPTQKLIFERILNATKEFRTKDIYESADFKAILKDAKQTSPLSVAFANALNGIEIRLDKIGLKLEDIVNISGGPRSRVFAPNVNIVILDENALSQVESIADFLLDEMRIGQPLDIYKVTARFFGLVEMPARYKPAAKQAADYLVSHLHDDPDLQIDRENGTITLNEVHVVTDNTSVQAPDRGEFVRITADSIVYSNQVYNFTQTESKLVAALITSQQRGFTRAYLKNYLQELKVDISTFDADFAKLRAKLGHVLIHDVSKGKSRFRIRPK